MLEPFHYRDNSTSPLSFSTSIALALSRLVGPSNYYSVRGHELPWGSHRTSLIKHWSDRYCNYNGAMVARLYSGRYNVPS
jgi:hypothetical protein